MRTASPGETERLGASLGEAAFAGAVVLLEGDLGAGKTALARGLARGLGAAGPVTSPSFTILVSHGGRLTFHHLDLYRVENPADLRAVDLDEVFAAGGVAAVEWPRWLLESPPSGTLLVRIGVEGGEARNFEIEALDPRWEEALGLVEARHAVGTGSTHRAGGAGAGRADDAGRVNGR